MPEPNSPSNLLISAQPLAMRNSAPAVTTPRSAAGFALLTMKAAIGESPRKVALACELFCQSCACDESILLMVANRGAAHRLMLNGHNPDPVHVLRLAKIKCVNLLTSTEHLADL